MAVKSVAKGLNQASNLIPVEGWAHNATRIVGDAPPVVLNQDATPVNMLTWGIAQIEQSMLLMTVIGCSKPDIIVDPSELLGAFRHQIEPALAVLNRAAEVLLSEERAAAPR